MIHEPYFWKQSLLQSANKLQRMRFRKSNEEYGLVTAEREIFLGFYSVRKLLDTFKVSPQTRKAKFTLFWSPCVGFVDYYNWHRIEELFDLDALHKEERDILFLCNQFIHSVIFIHLFSEEGSLAGVYVSSDKDRTAERTDSGKNTFLQRKNWLHQQRC